MFHTNYSTDGDKFQNYYKDVSLRMKNKELDLLIVVNMFLTGFDATTLNTLWVDKNLKMQRPLVKTGSRFHHIYHTLWVFLIRTYDLVIFFTFSYQILSIILKQCEGAARWWRGF